MFNFEDTRETSEAGAWVHLDHGTDKAYVSGPDGEPDKTKPVRIKVYGPDSPTLQKRKRARIAKRLARSGGADIQKMNETEIAALLDKNENADFENWADATMGWENIPDGQGGFLAFTPKAAEDLYTRYPAIVRQLERDAGADKDGGCSNFLRLAKAS